MSYIWLGVIAIVAGLIFCFRGYLALRAVIAVWGGFVGFTLGASAVAAITQQPLLAGWFGWIAAIAGAVLLAWLAYAFYAVAVIVAMGSVGYALGSGAAALFGAPSWVGALVGLAGALVLVLVALVTNLPELLLILVAASGGASAIIAGIAVLLGGVPLSSLGTDALAQVIAENWWLNVVYFALLVAGIVTQLRKRSAASLRDSYH